tara:strand:+ start:11919 stop:12092 length:174 start_codon:yes stop_codon:yes gene_type:complete
MPIIWVILKTKAPKYELPALFLDQSTLLLRQLIQGDELFPAYCKGNIIFSAKLLAAE